MWSVVLAQAPDGAQPGPSTAQPGAFNSMLPMLLVFFAIMYFLMIRPQQKREKERRLMLSALSKGDKVVTTGGIMGTVVGLTERTVVLRVDDNVNIEFLRGAISQVTSQEKVE